MASIKQKKREHFIARDGGLHHAERLLGRYNHNGIGTVKDVVFVYMHLTCRSDKLGFKLSVVDEKFDT
jgi:acetoin utilization deacetylase AcuC-like enzyme